MEHHCNFNCNQQCKNDNCERYKEKADQLFMQAKYTKKEQQRLIDEARRLDNESQVLQKRAQELCIKANMAVEEAACLDKEYLRLLEMASCYLQQMNECYKYSGQSDYHILHCSTNCGEGNYNSTCNKSSSKSCGC